MKLWWPHCEALIAFLMAYSQTKKPELLQRFSQVYEYTFNHVSRLCRRVSALMLECGYNILSGKYCSCVASCM